jgi:hypothetical protein
VGVDNNYYLDSSEKKQCPENYDESRLAENPQGAYSDDANRWHKWESSAGGANGWMMRHVFLAPGGLWRFSAIILVTFGGGLLILSLATAEGDERAALLFMAGFFLVLSLFTFIVWLFARNKKS